MKRLLEMQCGKKTHCVLLDVDYDIDDVPSRLKRAVSLFFRDRKRGRRIAEEATCFTWKNAFDCIPENDWSCVGIDILQEVQMTSACQDQVLMATKIVVNGNENLLPSLPAVAGGFNF